MPSRLWRKRRQRKKRKRRKRRKKKRGGVRKEDDNKLSLFLSFLSSFPFLSISLPDSVVLPPCPSVLLLIYLTDSLSSFHSHFDPTLFSGVRGTIYLVRWDGEVDG